MRPIWRHTAYGSGDGSFESEVGRRREKAVADMLLPELFASMMPRAPRDGAFQLASLVIGSPRREQAAEAWRPSAEALTGENSGDVRPAEARGPAPAAGKAGDVDGRLVTHIEAGDLGRIRLVVERTNEGLRVSLAIEDALVAAAAEAQRAQLEQSLRASGLQIVSVTIAHAQGGGTVLAQHSFARGAEAQDATDEGRSGSEPAPGRVKRFAKRLNVTG